MKKTGLFAAAGFLAFVSLAGCTPEARKDVGEAGQNVGQATEKSAEATGEVVSGAAREADRNLERAGEAVENTAENAGEAVTEGARRAGEAVGGVAQNAGKEVQDAGQAMSLTPKVKNALVADKSVDASTIDVDTSGEKDTVILKGTVRSEAEKTRATQIAKKALTDAGSQFKLKNNLTVQK